MAIRLRERSARSPQRSLQGDEAGEDNCDNADEGNGTVNVTHDCPHLPIPGQFYDAADWFKEESH
jgi:hypothetical protein